MLLTALEAYYCCVIIAANCQTLKCTYQYDVAIVSPVIHILVLLTALQTYYCCAIINANCKTLNAPTDMIQPLVSPVVHILVLLTALEPYYCCVLITALQNFKRHMSHDFMMSLVSFIYHISCISVMLLLLCLLLHNAHCLYKLRQLYRCAACW